MAVTPGDVVLLQLPQAGGQTTKMRPALALAALPGSQSVLVCGISSSAQAIAGWDEPITSADDDFATSGLRRDSVIRLSFVHAVSETDIKGRIGSVPHSRVILVLQRLANFLRAAANP